jgi:16S rRNA (uracil1498-N3)-methyltransferase
MQRYFIKNQQFHDQIAVLKDSDFHHIKHVMRNQLRDQIIVCNEDGLCYIASIKGIENKEIIVEVISDIPLQNKAHTITIAQALIRKERFEYMLQKSTELGCDFVVPTQMKNSIIKINKDKEKNKIERWNTITKEASEQSHRNTINQVQVIQTLKEIKYQEYDVVLVAYEKENHNHSLVDIVKREFKNILILIGPEGGFDPSEISFLAGLQNVSFIGLGPRILRSETASSYILSVLSFVYEMGANT